MQKQEQKTRQTNPFSEMEEEVLNFWEKNKIFEKSVKNLPKHHPIPLLRKEREIKSPYAPFYKGGNRDYVFYDGPPFATGTPHYGHIVASIMKDVVPRYWTMRGYRVERRWGWDCHGLPIENIVEKELGIKSKKDIIEKIGVEKFNETCHSKVLGYVEDWKKVIRRLGRWADMESAYKTMDLDFMESVWWVFRELYDKGLIYEGYRSMLVCPRCETTLSQQEVAEGYKDIKDLSAVVKFELEETPQPPFKKGGKNPLNSLLQGGPNNTSLVKGGEGGFDGKIDILAWTTTPWTLIGNVALAVGEDINYTIWEVKVSDVKNFKIGDKFIMSKEFDVNKVTGGTRADYGTEDRGVIFRNVHFEDRGGNVSFELIREFKGKDLIGKKYKPLFPYYAPVSVENSPHRSAFSQRGSASGWKIYAADFVTTEEGTGVVHIAPAFGEDDMNLGKKYNLPFIQHVKMDGTIKEEAIDFKGKSISPRAKNKPEEIREIDLEIIRFLGDKIFSSEKYPHSYPHCWRCETPLINYATSSWFVNILKIKERMLKTAKKINWSPKHIKEGRFGMWLQGARDWSISRQRFWASIIPIWRCDKETPQPPFKKGGNANTPLVKGSEGGFRCGNIKVIGSIKELEELSGEKITDLHKHIVDKITFPCEKCGGMMKRIPDVLDCWFESGSMPYAQMHYPFENKKKFEKNFPAEFIAEGIDQTRAWFYYLHAIANGIKKTHAFKNAVVNGIVLAEDGKKMSKRLENYPDPSVVFDQYGADALRYYLLTSPVMFAENLNFAEKGVQGSLRNVVMILWNVYKFYELFTNGHELKTNGHESNNILDKWILARLNQLIKEVTDGMNNYNLPKAARPIEDFINDLSTWYLRRSRERFKNTPPTLSLIKGGNKETPLLNKEGLGEVNLDKQVALETTYYVLLQLSKIIAPFMPFVAENLWQKVSGNNFKNENESVHLEEWPISGNRKQETGNKILEEMGVVRKIVELGLAKRDEAGIKVRQPLNKFSIFNFQFSIYDYIDLIKDELNVKNIEVIKGDGELSVKLDTEITPELKLEGMKRELVRFINNLRKEAGMTIQNRAEIYYETESKEIKEVFDKLGAEILKDTLSDEIINDIAGAEIKKEVKVNGEEVILGISKK